MDERRNATSTPSSSTLTFMKFTDLCCLAFGPILLIGMLCRIRGGSSDTDLRLEDAEVPA